MNSQIKIALLATGDELTTGDILNTNGQAIAQTLKDNGFTIGMHLIASDDETEITKAIQFLLIDHSILITIGGLGPTSDDRTRFALSRALNKPLVFNAESWQHITDRLAQFRLHVHEANKQQALFPENAVILQNPHGTANGCMLQEQTKLIFMLPGPPHECLPMFEQHVLEQLKQFQHDTEYHLKWRLFGVSEGEIAAKLDALMQPYPVVTGYRWYFPYLEFKLRTTQAALVPELIALIDTTIAPHVICTPDKSASDLLRDQISQFPAQFFFNDNATGGLLQTTLTSPQTKTKLNFICVDEQKTAKWLQQNIHSTDTVLITVAGLTEVWQAEKPTGSSHLTINIQLGQKQYEFKQSIPFRNKGVLVYAVELICHQINQKLVGH